MSGELYQYTVTTNIPLDWNSASVELITAPEGMSATNGVISWTPNESQVSQHSINFQVVDVEHGIAEQSFDMNVISANQAPIANDIQVVLIEDSSLDIQLIATDPNSDSMTFELLFEPENGMIQQNGSQFLYTPVENFFGTDSFQYIANDGQFNSNTATVSIEVTGENDAPEILSEPLLSILENNQYIYLVEAIDVDDNPITFTLSQKPVGMNIDAITGQLSWLPTNEQLGEHNITINVVDSLGANVVQNYVLQVVNVNDAPFITSTPIKSTNENELYSYIVIASDPDIADTLSFSLDIAPVGMMIDPASGLITWTPIANQIGSHSVTLSVTDTGGLTDSQEFLLLVENVNDAPTIVTTPDENAIAEVLYQSQVIAEDLDGDILSYSLTSGPVGLEVDTQTGVITWLPSIENIGLHTVSIDIHDGNNGHAELGYAITVEDNQHLLPVISSNPILIANLGMPYGYDVNAQDPSGGLMEYSLASAPIGMDIVSDTGLISWVAPEEGRFDVSILVTNDLGLSVSQSYSIDVIYVEPKHEGSDFWLAFAKNLTDSSEIILYISGKETTSGIVEVPLEGITIPFNVTAGEITEVSLPISLWTSTLSGVEGKGIHVTSEDNIVLYGLNYSKYSTDAFLVMPTETLGMEYRAMTYNEGLITVVAPQDDTIVIFEFAEDVGTGNTGTLVKYKKGETISITLNKGQTYSISTNENTLTGTRVSSNKPTGVFSGNYCVFIPTRFGSCDHIVEQMSDIAYWGQEYFFVPLELRAKGDTVRVVAAFDNTVIRINDKIVTTLQAGERIEAILIEPSKISANKPIMVAQFSNGESYDRGFRDVGGRIGDPFMMLLTGERNFISEYTFTTTNQSLLYNYANVVIEQSDTSSLLFDGVLVNTDNFSPIEGTTKLAGVITLTEGTHSLSAQSPFGAYIYGFGDWVSYGYQGGMKLPRFASTDELQVSLSGSSPHVSDQLCISAIFLNNQFPKVDIRADFIVTGANSATGHSYTDQSGQASYCYIGKVAGIDTIRVNAGLSSIDATTEWQLITGNGTSTPVIISEPIIDALIDTLYEYQVDVYDADPNTIFSFNLVTFPQGMTINATGLIQWSPTQTDTGNDTVSVKVLDESNNEDIQTFQISTYQGNRAPYFIITPSIEVAYINHYYNDNVTYADPDGDIVYCENFDSDLFGDTDPNYGLCSLIVYLREEHLGEHQINLRIYDRKGAETTYQHTILVKENHRPEVIEAPAPYARVGDVYQSQLVVIDPDNDDLTMAISSIKHVESGRTISTTSVDFNSKTGEISWTPLSEHGGEYQFLVKIYDAIDITGYNFSIFVSPADQPFESIVTTTPLYPQVNESVTLQVSSQGAVGDVTYSLLIDGLAVELDDNNQFVYNDTATVGTHSLTLTATNSAGETTITQSSFSVNDGADVTLPIAILNSPDDASRITTLTDIFVTATDDNISQWKLILISASDELNQHVLAQGVDSLSNEKAGVLDPTMLVNGQYHLQLEVTDTSGQTTYDGATVSVEGNLKVGNFTYTVDEFTYPMAGLPITVSRTYDSRRKHEKLDFGYGWFLSYNGIKLEKSRGLGKAWQLNEYPAGPLGILNNYCVESVGKIIATVSLPNDKVERFQVKASPECNLGTPIFDVNLAFIPLDNTQATLAPQGNPLVRLVDGNLEILGNSEVYDVDDFTLTTRAGFKYNFNAEQGITFAEEPNGNRLTFNNTGIHHSSGKSVTLSRSGVTNFIGSITSPDNHVYYYSYDNYANLVEGRTPRGGTENYTYNYRHGLLDIIDNEGRTKVKNIYDDENRLIAQEDNKGDRIEFAHDIAGRQSTITDRRGNLSFYYYDDEGNVTSKVDALGHTTAYTYDTNNNLLTTTDPLGHVSTNVYSEKNDLLSQTDANGSKQEYTYNERGQELILKDASGAIYTNTYDSVGNLLSITDPNNNVVGNNINAQGLVSLLQDAQGNTTTFEYDALGNKTKEIDVLGNSTTYTYSSANLVKTKTVSRSLVDGSKVLEPVSYVYDSMGNLTQYNNGVTTKYYINDLQGNKTREDDGGSIQYKYDVYNRNTEELFLNDSTSIQRTYDSDGNQTAEKDQNGNITQFEYDALSRLVKTIHPDNTFTLVNYDAKGRVSSEVDERNNTTTYEYDKEGQRTKITDALGNAMRFSYDANGNVLTETDALGHITTYQYDVLGHRVSTTFFDSNSIAAVHDVLGRKTQKTDQAGISTDYQYDALGRLTKVLDATEGATSYGYDEVGNKISQTDAMGRVTRWEYNSRGLVTARTLPEGQRESFTYNAQGGVLTKTDFNGELAQYNYTHYRRVSSINYTDGSDSYTYDNNGNRISVNAHGTGTWFYEYDSRNRLTKETQPNGDVLAYSYDGAGNKTKLTVTYANGDIRTETSTYDALNRLATVTDTVGSETTYTYDAVGNRSSVTHSNNNITAYVYDTLNRLTQLQDKKVDGTVYQQFDYTLDVTGRRTKLTELNGRVSDYTYDELYRLTSESITDAVNGNYTASYAFDKVGNRTESIINGVTTAYTYDDNDRLLQTGGDVYTYDDNGNTLSKTIDSDTTTYTYDARQKLTAASITQAGIITNTSYQYNIDGIRIEKVKNGTATNYLIDSNRDYAQVIAETDSSENVNVEYVFGDDLLSQKRGVEVANYHYDGLGSTRSLTDSNGNATDSYFYDAFGETLAQTGSTENDYLFTGEQYDAELDNYYLRARYYDQGIGRFTQKDTWMGGNSDPITLHKYLYANADSVNHIDPSGNFSIGGLMSTINTAATLITVADAGYSIGDVLYGNVVNDEPFDFSVENAKQIGFAALFSVGASKVVKMLSKNKKFKKLFKERKLLRGVNNTHLGYSDALRGYVGGNYGDFFKSSTYSEASATQHNNGNTHNTMFSSWTTKRRIAKHFATFESLRKKSYGVVIRAKIMTFRIFKSPNLHGIGALGTEGEWLVVGPVQGIPTLVK